MNELQFCEADWDAPAQVRALTTTRIGGVSTGPFSSLNLGDQVGDTPADVAANRALLGRVLGLPSPPVWLQQVHGTDCVDAEQASGTPSADGSFAHGSNIVCAVLTADCLPVLLCNDAGSVVAAVHCGWRGLASGILAAVVARMGVPAATLMAWFGPAIGAEAFEVGEEVRSAFVARDALHEQAFRPVTKGKYMGDIYRLARRELAAVGVVRVSGGGFCTVSDSERFYSYRRDAQCGRMASLIWMQG